MAGPRDPVGRRVTLRYRVDDPTDDRRVDAADPAPASRPGSATDVVGRLLEADDASLLVERRDGSTVRVARDRVLLLKVVPERPVRARRAADVGTDDLVRTTSRGWPATESVTLGAWELRWSHGFTGRACSVAVHGDPGLPDADALAEVVAFYRDRGAPPLAQVVVGSPWERRFLDHGWVPQEGYRGGALVQVADLVVAPEPDPRVTIGPRATDDWLARYDRVDDVAAARAVLEGPRTVGFAQLGDPAVAVGRVVVTGEWAGVAAVETHPDHRRRGLADAVVASCLAWAHARGATRAYLQTMPTNTAALALYEPYGFATHHAYRYLRPDPHG